MRPSRIRRTTIAAAALCLMSGAMLAGARQVFAATVTIQITNCGGTWCFPSGATPVNSGDTVVWSNVSSATHTATSDDGHSFDTGDISSGASSGGVVVNLAPGDYPYHCDIHPSMHGTLHVNGTASTPPPTPASTPRPTPPPTVKPTPAPTPASTPASTPKPAPTPVPPPAAATATPTSAPLALGTPAQAGPTDLPSPSPSGAVGAIGTTPSSPSGSHTGLIIAVLLIAVGVSIGAFLLRGRLRPGSTP